MSSSGAARGNGAAGESRRRALALTRSRSDRERDFVDRLAMALYANDVEGPWHGGARRARQAALAGASRSTPCPRAAGFLATYDGAIREGVIGQARADRLKDVVRDRVDALQREQQSVGGNPCAAAAHLRQGSEACAWHRTQEEQEVRTRHSC